MEWKGREEKNEVKEKGREGKIKRRKGRVRELGVTRGIHHDRRDQRGMNMKMRSKL